MLPNETLDAVTIGRKGFRFDEDGNFRGTDTPEAMTLFTLHAVAQYLRLEIKTGMKMTAKASTLAKANQLLGTKYKRKQQALDHIESVLQMANELPIDRSNSK